MIFYGSRKSPTFPAKVSVDNIHADTAKMEEKNPFDEEVRTVPNPNLKAPFKLPLKL